MSTNPIRRSCPVYPRLPVGEYFSRDLCLLVMAHQPWAWSQPSMGAPCQDAGPLSTGAVGCWDGAGVGGACVPAEEEMQLHSLFAIHPYTCKVSSSKWQSNGLPTYGMASAKHGLDMETTCICILLTAGSMSPSQPSAITERLLFSFLRELITSLLY